MGIAALAGAGISAAGSLFSGVANSQAASYQAQVAKNNAQIATENAAWTTQSGDIQAQNKGMETRNKVGAIKAGITAGGVDVNTGSAAQTVSSADALGMQDALTIRNNAARQAYGYKVQATSDIAQSQLDTFESQNAIPASILSGASSLATGVGKYYQNVGF